MILTMNSRMLLHSKIGQTLSIPPDPISLATSIRPGRRARPPLGTRPGSGLGPGPCSILSGFHPLCPARPDIITGQALAPPLSSHRRSATFTVDLQSTTGAPHGSLHLPSQQWSSYTIHGFLYSHCDVTAAVDLARFGRLNIMVNNEGVSGARDHHDIRKVDLGGFQRDFAVNVDGVFLGQSARPG
ncbi:Zerumbone synthase [Nymphaea thermarum]|nr:Zerumbone synthase [Nymphaea thermarum]